MSGYELWQLLSRYHKRKQLIFVNLILIMIAILLVGCSVDSATEPVLSPEPHTGESLHQISTVVAVSTPSHSNSLQSFGPLVEKISPAVVTISVESITRGFFFDFTDEGAGSGMIVHSDGYIVTNFHVIQGALDIQISLSDGDTYPATVIGQDPLTDLAVLKIDAEELATVEFGDSHDMRVGDWVIALGNVYALKGGPTVTLGIVSAKGRTLNTERGSLYDLLQTDAAINEGNSGGPLVNLKGQVVGINTAMLRDAQGIGFAVSSSVASPIIDSLIKNGRVVRPLIGLTGANVTPSRASRLNLSTTEGVIVTGLSEGGPAFDGGIRIGDVIVKLNGIEVPNMARFLTLLWTFDVGDMVKVEYVRDNQVFETSVELEERPSG